MPPKFFPGPRSPQHRSSVGSAGAYLDAAEGAGALMPKVKRLLELRRVLSGTLPANLVRSCTVANAGQGRIVLFAENSVVAAKLKLLLPGLRAEFVKNGVEATSLIVQVQPPESTPATPAKDVHMSAAAAAAVTGLSKQLADSPLKEALLSLASRGREKQR
jgi:hypothetical protein